ncbi:MAG: aminopeptidase P family protein [Sphingomonadaceae bacterium]
MTIASHRLAALRAELAERTLDGFVVPLTDEHMSEYVGLYARRLEWLTGFSGSAGTAVVLADKAAIFVDGRYTLQVRQQVEGNLYSFHGIPAESIAEWLGANAPDGARIGYDPWLTTRTFLSAAANVGVNMEPVPDNPVDAVWPDQPVPSDAPAEIQPLEYSGRESADKRAEVVQALEKWRADALILTQLDEIAWLFNIRGKDVPRTPVVRAFAILNADATATLFLDPAKSTPELTRYLGPDVTVRPYTDFAGAIPTLSGKIWLDPATAVSAIPDALDKAGAECITAPSPVLLPKAIKNPAEIAGARAAHLRDGVAVTRFLQWVDEQAPTGTLDELKAEIRLEAFRRESGMLQDLSFDSISSFGPNGAVVHYRATPETNRPFSGGSLYLIDSGGQYRDGTTDITRTIAIGTPTPEMRECFTRVLKGHIALATIRFPKGTSGGQLDVLARQFLWAAGMDYAHGTGHGVGSYLSVHEGPQRIATMRSDEVLQPGMIISNEPGYYAADAWGIRIENLILVRKDSLPGDQRPMLAFDTLTLAPIDRRLIETAMLTPAEITWIDAYHAAVRTALTPHLDDLARGRLAAQTAPLGEA